MVKARITELVFGAIGELNEQLPRSKRVRKSLESSLFGSNGALDSLGLVNLIVELEQRVEDDFGRVVRLTDERAMSTEHNCFSTVQTLVDYLTTRLGEDRE